MTKPLTTFREYTDAVWEAMESVDANDLFYICRALDDARANGRTIFVCGNGGSAAIANHLVCDCMKGVAVDAGKHMHVTSLACNVPLMTAIANDIGYDEVFSSQLEWQAVPGDVLIAISSSGESPNIVNALFTARDMGVTTIAISGFSGGIAVSQANHSVHIKSDNYGVIEDVSQSVMHYIAQTLRRTLSDKNPEDIKY